jgi:hypothetical protein
MQTPTALLRRALGVVSGLPFHADTVENGPGALKAGVSASTSSADGNRTTLQSTANQCDIDTWLMFDIITHHLAS